MLTKKQLDLLIFLEKSILNNLITPSFDEMKDALNLKSKSGVHRLIRSLEERGYIKRLANKARAIEIIKRPSNFSVIDKNIRKKEINSENNYESSKLINIPLLGKIAAGSPIEAIQNKLGEIEIPISLLRKGEHFALKVEGDSMIEAGINCSDIVLIKKQKTANNGDIVVALIENQEATLKKLKIKNTSIYLEPANKNYEIQVYDKDQVEIQGKLIALIRSY